MNTQELETIRRYNLNIKFFVLNNGGYASIRNMQRNYFEGRLIGSNPESGLDIPIERGIMGKVIRRVDVPGLY